MDIKKPKTYFLIVSFLAAALTIVSLLCFDHKNYYQTLLGSPASKDLEVEPPKTADLEVGLPSEIPDNVKDIKILFLGDVMFDRWIRQVAERKGYDFVFGDTDNLLKDKDLVIGNLEGSITDNQSISVASELGARNNYIFTFDPQTAQVLKDHNIGLVNLGNNHTLNFGQNGLKQTEKYLSDAGVNYLCTNESRIRNYELEKLKVGFVCYNQFEKEAVEKAERDIKGIRGEADFVILYAHWGKEYETSILPIIRMLGHKFIDSGADLIISSHPHVVQEKEIYNGKTIYYSLGNFIFDQYFDPNAQKGLAVEAIIDPTNKNIIFREHNLRLKTSGQTELEK